MTELGLRIPLLPAICLVLALLVGCDEPKQAAAPPPKPAVGVRAAAMKGVNQSFEFVGRIKAVNKVEVRARVEGFLEKILFREGQDVKAGDPLSSQRPTGQPVSPTSSRSSFASWMVPSCGATMPPSVVT